jgi:hypothetical protein
MKPVLTAMLLVISFSTASFAAAHIDIYADVNHTICALYDNVQPPVVFVYYFLSGASESTGVRFAAFKPACWIGASWAGDNSPYISIGTTQTDYSLGLGACMHGTVYLGKTAYVVSGTGTPCCQVEAGISVDHHFVYTICNFGELPLSPGGAKVTINPNASCPCQVPVAIESSTWGRVKSLYR